MAVRNGWRGQWQGHPSRQAAAKRSTPSCQVQEPGEVFWDRMSVNQVTLLFCLNWLWATEPGHGLDGLWVWPNAAIIMIPIIPRESWMCVSVSVCMDLMVFCFLN